MPDSLPTGTVTFLFSDIEGSTPLWEREPNQMQLALERHHAILHESIAACGGHVFKTVGDAFQAAFDVSSQAVRAALAAQRALAAEVWPTSTPVRVRMGLHAGHARTQADDYATTHTLNRVARMMSAAHGGQILLSEAVAELIRDDLPAGLSLRDMGHHHLKGLTHLEHIFQVVVPDLSANFPPLNTLDGSANNLPTQLTTFIGRETEVAEVKRLLSESALNHTHRLRRVRQDAAFDPGCNRSADRVSQRGLAGGTCAGGRPGTDSADRGRCPGPDGRRPSPSTADTD